MLYYATQPYHATQLARLKPRYAGCYTMLHNPEKPHEVIKVNHLATCPLPRTRCSVARVGEIV